MAFNIRITHIQGNQTVSDLPVNPGRPKNKRAVAAKTAAARPTLVTVPDVSVFNKYPVRIFNVES